MSAGDRVRADDEASDERARDAPDEELPTVAVTRTSPDRTVFTEEGNTDGWIATDLTVDLER